MTQKPYELLARFNADGTIAGIHTRHLTTVDGKDYEGNPIPLADATDPAFVAFAEQFAASAIAERDELKTRAEELQKQVEELQAFRPYNPRIIDASKFFDRITKDEFAKLSTSDDATLVTIAKTIVAYKDNDWPVIFESPEMVGMLDYLSGVGFISEERKAELIADASQAEAYNAD